MLEIHNSSGLWLLIPATVLAFTSVAMNFFDEAFVPAVEAISPAKPSIFDNPATPAATALDADRDLQKRSRRIGRCKVKGIDWQPALERFNSRAEVYGISFTDNGVENYHRLGPVTYYIDAASGRVVESTTRITTASVAS